MINFNSSTQLRALLFGGTIKVTTKEPLLNEDGTFKLYSKGKKINCIRMKNIMKEITFRGFGITPKSHWKTETGLISTKADVLNEIIQMTKDSEVEEHQELNKICSILVETSGLETLLNTYYTGHRELIYPDGCLRGNYGHCTTVTGRLGCSTPNLQNVTDPVTEHLVTRF